MGGQTAKKHIIAKSVGQKNTVWSIAYKQKKFKSLV